MLYISIIDVDFYLLIVSRFTRYPTLATCDASEPASSPNHVQELVILRFRVQLEGVVLGVSDARNELAMERPR